MYVHSCVNSLRLSANYAQKRTSCSASTKDIRQLRHIRRNEEHMAPPRPVIHLPSVLLPPPHLHRLGSRLRRWLLTRPPHNPRLHLRALHRPLPSHRNNSILPRRPLTRARRTRTSRKAKARPICTARGGGAAGVRILLRCIDTSLLPRLGIPIRHPVSSDAHHREELLGLAVLWQLAVPPGFWVLQRNNVPRIQW